MDSGRTERTSRDGPWTRRPKTAKAGGRRVKDGPVLKINWDIVHRESTGSLGMDDIAANAKYREGRALQALDDADQILSEKERRALDRDTSNAMTILLADRRSWCSRCLNVLHNCSCLSDFDLSEIKVTEPGVALIHRLRQEDLERKEIRKAQEKLARRKAFNSKKGQA